MDKKVVLLHKNEEYGTNLKISFATDSRTKGVQKSGFSEISKKKTSNTKNVLFVFLSSFSNRNDFFLDLF
ncbi:Uncharacterised protein [Enterococcus durans]|uniref:Uncharacterized protein n=1 Tax=Enterococcus durans TaxID=53345 RepID=A0A377KL07_9ENTE|nr:Uncharacterised protein [Enterococcus durans]